LPGNSAGDFISSAGIGMNFQMWKHLSGVLNVGFPFNALGPVKSGDPRLHFNIATDF